MLLNVKNLTKVYSSKNSKTIANDNLSFSMKEGEIVGLLGHNGAGKTTFVNQIIGLLKPNHGQITLLGQSIIEKPEIARSICSVQPQAQIPLGFLTPYQAVSIMGRMRSGGKRDLKKRIDMLFDTLDIGEWSNIEGVNLSGGVRRLTAFCMAVVAPGKLVILDEPTNDVDPIRRRYLWDVIRQLTKDGTSVILVTHNVMEAEKAVDRVAIMDKGKFIAVGTPSEIKNSVSNLIRVELSLSIDSKKMDIPDWTISSHRNGFRIILSVKPETVAKTVDWIIDRVENGIINDYTLSPTTLEDIYVKLTTSKEASNI